MQSIQKIMGFAAVVVLMLLSQVSAGELNKTFEGVKEIRIKTVSGDCIVQKGNGDEVKVEVQFTYDERDFEPEMEQRGARLELAENFRSRSSSRGRSTWTLTVPENTDIDFSTASGDLEVSDLKSMIDASSASGDVALKNIRGEIEVSTASGEIEGRNIKGRLEISTASGDIDVSGIDGEPKFSTASGNIRASGINGEIKMSAASGNISLATGSGEFELSAASGDVDAEDLTLTERSSFSAASGDVEVSFAKSPEFDVKASSASGDAIVNFNGNPIRGYIEMTARTRNGRIKAPFEFDEEEVYYRGDAEYVTKIARKNSDLPRIEISTASGVAALLEK